MAPGGVIFLCDKASEDSSLLPLWEKVILAKRGSDEGSLSAETDPSPVFAEFIIGRRFAPTRAPSHPLPQGESDYLRCQVALAYWARASRAFALRRTSSLWARAIRTTIFSFPAASNLSRNSARVLSYLAAIAATRNRIERTLARPPRMDRLPWRLPLSSASGARPTSLAMALLE